MASPTAPTLSQLVSEALYQAGESDPSTTLTDRAEDTWMEEIKADIYEASKKLKSLQTKGIQVLTRGLPQYSNPSDFACDLGLVYATGSRYGTASAGSTTSVTLASTETAVENDILGKEIVITAGTGLGGIAYITAYNPTTKVATISPAWTAPVNGDTYLILNVYKDLGDGKPLFRFADIQVPYRTGEPEDFYILGDSSNGKYILSPTPYRADGQPMIVIQRYYADITELDLGGTLLLNLYQKWRSVWMAGLKWKAFLDGDDDRETKAGKEYRQAINKMIAAEGFGMDTGGVQMQVRDY